MIADNSAIYLENFGYNDNNLSGVVEDEELIKAINILTDRQKEILFQSVVIGLTDTEIAKALGISKQAVGKSKNSSIAKLKAILNANL